MVFTAIYFTSCPQKYALAGSLSPRKALHSHPDRCLHVMPGTDDSVTRLLGHTWVRLTESVRYQLRLLPEKSWASLRSAESGVFPPDDRATSIPEARSTPQRELQGLRLHVDSAPAKPRGGS